MHALPNPFIPCKLLIPKRSPQTEPLMTQSQYVSLSLLPDLKSPA